MNSAAIRELKLNDKSAEFSDNMKIVRRSDGTGKFENIMVDTTNNFLVDLISFKFKVEIVKLLSNISEWITERRIWVYQGLGSY